MTQLAPLFFLPAALAGYPVDDGLVVGLTPEALERLGAFVPDSLPVEDFGDSWDLWICKERIAVTGLEVYPELLTLEVTPGQDELQLEGTLSLSTNDAEFSVQGCLDDVCLLHIEPTEMKLWLSLDFAFYKGVISAQVSDYELVFVEDLKGVLSDCDVAAIMDLLEALGLDVYEWIAGYMADSMVEELELALNEALAGLVLDQELALGAGVLTLHMEPSFFAIDAEGLTLRMSSELIPQTSSQCDPGDGPASTAGEVPALDAVADYALAAALDDDLANALLVAACEAGCLNMDLQEVGSFSLSTVLLNSLSADEFYREQVASLFPGKEDLLIATRPARPPSASFGGDNHVVLTADELGIGFFALLDGRWARLFSIAISGDLGLDPEIEGGQYALSLEADWAALDYQTGGNEHFPGLDEEFEAGMPALLNSVPISIPPDDLPRFEGLTIGSATVVSGDGAGVAGRGL